MTLGVNIKGEKAGFADIQDNSLLTSVLPYPPLDVEDKIIPLIGSLTVSGDDVTTNLNVDGSVTPVDAFIGPPVNGDLYITTANVLIADNGSVQLNKFGSINNGLTNGIRFFIESKNERIIVSAPLRTNFDFIRAGTLTEGLGSGASSYKINNADIDNDNGYNPIIDFTRLSPIGIRMRADTQDKLGVVISDDLTEISTFNIIITGFIRIK